MYISKTRFFGLRFFADSIGLSLTIFDLTGPKATEFGEITQHNGHYAVQDL